MAIIDWNKKYELAESAENLLEAIKRRDIAEREIAYWTRKMRESIKEAK